MNLDGVFLSVKYAVPAIRRTGGGSIIITSSVAGLRGSAGLAGYCATKGGVQMFAKAGRDGLHKIIAAMKLPPSPPNRGSL
jgi:NAD(P)-dependent dehydrogenase (short-subunit alcohol dehydrogenase family)